MYKIPDFQCVFSDFWTQMHQSISYSDFYNANNKLTEPVFMQSAAFSEIQMQKSLFLSAIYLLVHCKYYMSFGYYWLRHECICVCVCDYIILLQRSLFIATAHDLLPAFRTQHESLRRALHLNGRPRRTITRQKGPKWRCLY